MDHTHQVLIRNEREYISVNIKDIVSNSLSENKLYDTSEFPSKWDYHKYIAVLLLSDSYNKLSISNIITVINNRGTNTFVGSLPLNFNLNKYSFDEFINIISNINNSYHLYRLVCHYIDNLLSQDNVDIDNIKNLIFKLEELGYDTLTSFANTITDESIRIIKFMLDHMLELVDINSIYKVFSKKYPDHYLTTKISTIMSQV